MEMLLVDDLWRFPRQARCRLATIEMTQFRPNSANHRMPCQRRSISVTDRWILIDVYTSISIGISTVVPENSGLFWV